MGTSYRRQGRGGPIQAPSRAPFSTPRGERPDREEYEDYELLWKQQLTSAVNALSEAVMDLKQFMASSLEHRQATDDRLKKLENAGVGVRGWLSLGVAGLAFLVSASCGALSFFWQVYQSLPKR